MTKQIIFTNSDYKQLAGIIKSYKARNKLNSEHLYHLAEDLGNASVISHCDYLTDFVRINSTLVFKNLKTNESSMVTVVLPHDSSPDGSRISILSPLGAALIGEKEMSIVECYAPGQNMQLRIEKILAHHHAVVN